MSHGVDGALELGNAWLNGYSLEARADEIAQWSNALSANADILLYGCDVAADGQGQAFINRLAEITGADVAASQDATGSAALGGNWNLEYSTGSIESESAIDAETQQDWAHVMAITAGTSTSAATASGTSASSLTWSHTVGTGSNGILIIDVSIRTNAGVTVSSVTYGGVALTYIGSATSSKDHAEMWYLKVPVTGTANVVVTLTGSENVAAGATNFFGVDQTTSYGSLTTGNGSGDPSLTVASATGELVIDAVSDRDVDSETVGAGQTLLLTTKAGSASNDAWVGSSTEAGAASVTMSWTTTGAGAGEWAAVAVSLKPAVNNPPTITNLSGDSLSYAEGDGAVVIEQGSKPRSAIGLGQFRHGHIRLLHSRQRQRRRRLAIRNQGTGAGQIGVSGANVTYGGVTIGTYTGGSGGPISSSLSNQRDPHRRDGLGQEHHLSEHRYRGADHRGPTVRYVLTDGDGGTSANYDTTVTVSAVNDVPVLDNSGTMTFTSITEDDTNNSGQTVASVIASAEVTALPILTAEHRKGSPLPRSAAAAVPGSTTLAPAGPTSGPSRNRPLSCCVRSIRYVLFRRGRGRQWNISFRAWTRSPARPGPKSLLEQPVPSSTNSTAHRLVAITGHRTGPVLGLKPMREVQAFRPVAFKLVPTSCVLMPTLSATTSREKSISATRPVRP